MKPRSETETLRSLLKEVSCGISSVDAVLGYADRFTLKDEWDADLAVATVFVCRHALAHLLGFAQSARIIVEKAATAEVSKGTEQ
jgi:hypothetical protein